MSLTRKDQSRLKAIKNNDWNKNDFAPIDVRKIRLEARDLIVNATADVGLVLQGKKRWTTQQVNLYRILLNKIVPDATPVMTGEDKSTPQSRTIHDLSREELERIVALDAQQNVVSSTPVDHESPNSGSETPEN